jgi:hypothetical protein
MLSSALDYERLGFSVLVVGSDKRPIGSWKARQQVRAGPDLIREWFYDRPSANIGIVTGGVSGLVVIDIDNAAAETYAAGRGAPTTPTVRTCKGKHLYYRYPDGRTIKNKQALHGCAGLDIRGEGGYVVAPPSLHPEGVRYEWEIPLTEELAPLPAWVWEPPPPPPGREHAYLEAAIRGKLSDACARVRQAADGTKHETLRDNAVIIGGYLHYGIVSHGEAEAALWEALPPTVQDRQLALRTIRDGLAHGASRPLTVEAPQQSPLRERPPPQRERPAPQEGDEEVDEGHLTEEGILYRLPPGCTYSRGCTWRGERLLYLGKLLLTETGVNVHTGEQTALVQWRGGVQGACVMLRSDLASQSGITRHMGGAGAAIHPHNTKDVSRYLVEFIQMNRKQIAHSKHSEYYGNVEEGLILPAGSIGTRTRYIGKPIAVGRDHTAYLRTLQGVLEWATPTFWALLSMALSSPIYARMKTDRNPVAHLGGASGSGKTTIAHFATGCYGDPRIAPLQVQCGSGTTTPKGMSTALVQANGLPVFFDDLHKMLERKKAETEGIVYDFANGQNRSYGTPGNRATGGGQEVRGTLITAGETALNFANAGSNNRVFSFDCGAPGQQPLGCSARSNEGMRRARQLQSAWQTGAGTFGHQVCEHLMRDWSHYELDVRVFELYQELEPLQAWRRLLAVAATTLQIIAKITDLNLNIDLLLKQWSDILQSNNQAQDPAEEAFERVRLLMVQSEYSNDGRPGRVPTWHSLTSNRKLLAVRRDGTKVWRVLHTSREWQETVGANAVEMYGQSWLQRGVILSHKSGKISDTAWVGMGTLRCILVKDFLRLHGHDDLEENQ